MPWWSEASEGRPTFKKAVDLLHLGLMHASYAWYEPGYGWDTVRDAGAIFFTTHILQTWRSR
jgi:phytoene/squalene synthetase